MKTEQTVKIEKTMKYAKSTGGFYTESIHGANIPADAVDISDEQYESLLAGQSAGKRITADDDGVPFLEDYPGPTPEQQRVNLAAAVQAHIDDQAQALGYDDIKAAVTYADEPAVPKFQAEGRALRAWRSLVWERFNAAVAGAQSGAAPVPAAADIIAALPAFSM